VHAANFSRIRTIFVAALVLGYWSLLAYQHANGGVPSHSFLARSDMPEISNWWGVLIVPVVAWTLTGLVQRRLTAFGADRVAADRTLRFAVYAFVGALLYATIMATGFSLNRESEVISYMFFALPLFALLLPVFRPEYVLGFVLGLTYTFGPVLPLVIASGVSLMSALAHLLVRPLARRIFQSAR
jgi:hypothetical protein